ncbi:RNA polymerase-binding protein DksA [uncultured Limnohabitans sp.]|uniref:RNA polymerase-binding protein DksA n=1 Tax=Limnohabitans sp. TaxID=1907725 RepID=UPI0028EBF325|nr:RNA polymerase-binding protein DksA [uncultured Limnohabitans sp.]
MKTSKKPAAKVAQKKTPAKAQKPVAAVKKAAPVKAKSAPVKAVAKVKAAVKPKAPAKAPVKAKVAVTAKVSKSAAKAPTKAAPKVAAKAPVKAVPAKKPAKTLTGKKAAVAPKAAAVKTKPVVPAASLKAVVAAKSSPATKAKAAPAPSAKKADAVSQAKPMPVTKAEPVKAPVVPAPVATSPDQPVRATRPSARLAQITVPSLPQAVASTAAKASFLPSAPAPVAPSFTPIKKDAKLANNWKTKKLEELSDAEIIAMSDAEYMNDVQMAYFRRKLVTLKQDILNSAGETTEHLREDTVVVPDPADRATIEEEHALELRTRDRERKLLKKIEQSIIRIDAGDYGFCDETGEAIGVGRLLARPTATLSLEAQQRRELKQKMFGD